MAEDFVDLVLSEEERKEMYGGVVPSDTKAYEGPRYSYGTCINLGKRELEKMGLTLKDLPETGEHVAIVAVGYIKGKRFEERENDEDSLGLDIQMTEMLPIRAVAGYEGAKEEDGPSNSQSEIKATLEQALASMKEKK